MFYSSRMGSALGRFASLVATPAVRQSKGKLAIRQVNSLPWMTQRCLWAAVPRLEKRIVPCPSLADSITSGELSRWEKNIGDSVEKDGVVCVLETDKVDIEVSSPVNGVLTQQFVEQGNTIEVGEKMFEVDLDATPAPAPPAPEVTDSAPTAATPPPPPAAEKVEISPLPVPTPQAAPPPAPMAQPPAPILSSPATPVQPAFGERRVKMNRMRLRIAERLKDAQNTAAMLTTFNEVDLSNLVALRNKTKDDFFQKHNVKLGFMSAFLASSVAALKDQPIVNAVIDGQDIVYRDSIDISVAVASPKGLVVPVIRGCNNFNFADFEKAIAELGKKARDNNLAIEDMVGGTFTVSNGGVFGSLMGTPIINPPQSAILGMHGVKDRPMAVNGKVEIRPMMYIALTYDHRLIDGREAVLFLRHIKEMVEDPGKLLLAL